MSLTRKEIRAIVAQAFAQDVVTPDDTEKCTHCGRFTLKDEVSFQVGNRLCVQCALPCGWRCVFSTKVQGIRHFIGADPMNPRRQILQATNPSESEEKKRKLD